MDREEFEKNLKNAESSVDIDYIDHVIDRSLIPANGINGFMNLIVANEEFAECAQEVSKFLRHKGDHTALLEEVADAVLSIRYIQRICGITDEELYKALNVKVARQAERIKTGVSWV